MLICLLISAHHSDSEVFAWDRIEIEVTFAPNFLMYRLLCFFIIAIALGSCSPNNATIDDSLEKYFKENNVTGTFGMFDNGTGEFTIYNMPRFRDSAYLPASTFDIVNAVVGIETGRAQDSSFVIPADGKSLSMMQAFTQSSAPVFRELARRIGKDTMQHWLDTLGYASSQQKPVIKDNLDTFWLDNTVKVTADEQLGLVKKLYFTQLPFQPRSQRMVKNMMTREENANYILCYATGRGTSDKGREIGWNIGWIEENRHPYFFVLQIESADTSYDMAAHREKMLKDILRQYDFMEGKR